MPSERLAKFDSDLRKVIGAIRAIGAEPVIATHANAFMGKSAPPESWMTAWERFYPRATGATIVAFDSAARVATLRAGSDSGAVTVDIAQILATSSDESFADFVHLTDRGASHVAAALAPAVLAAAAARDRCATR